MAGNVHKVGDVDKPGARAVRIVHISDTHMRHDEYLSRIPAGDILVHSGDFAALTYARYFGNKHSDRERVIAEVDSFFEKVPFKHKILVAGNHEISFTKRSKEFVTSHLKHVTYLQDSSANVEGITFYGTPWNTKRWTSFARGFAKSNEDNAREWENIPEDTDILVTHLPPEGVMDLATKKFRCLDVFKLDGACSVCWKEHSEFEHWGSRELRETVLARVRPKIHMFGHVHECAGVETVGGVTFSNAAMKLTQTINLTIRNPVLVVGIDVGSTYSGYAWMWRDDFNNNRGNVEFKTNWGTGALQLHKTKTCLLLDKDGNIDSFGQRAERRFCNEFEKNPDTVSDNWFFLEGFKLILYQTKQGSPTQENCTVEDHFGRSFSIKEVMTKFIKALKDHFLDHLKTLHRAVDHDTILWVITVPQIWSDNAKAFMRICAEESGIKKSRLLLALEPEAAAIYCIHLPGQQRVRMNNLGNVGQRFLVADLGGGTVDISVTEVLEDGRLKEVCPGMGSQVGGQDVNHAFFQTCTDVIGISIWRDMFSKHAHEHFQLEEEFERRKVAIGIGSEQADEFIALPIPDEMKMKLKSNEIVLRDTDAARNYFKSDKGKFQFNSKFIREKLFDETVVRLTGAITNTMRDKNATGISTVILVGGFAESPIVIEKIRQSIEKQFPDVQVFVPTSPFRAVLYGAVLFGHDSFIFRSRVSKLTYGIRTNDPFDENVHDKGKRWTNPSTGKTHCKDIFSIHVCKGQSVTLGEHQPSCTHSPIYQGQTCMTLEIFSSSEKAPSYTTDPGCTKLGEIKVEMPDRTGDLSRKVDVTMVYGGTELAATAKDLTTGTDFKSYIRFDSVIQ